MASAGDNALAAASQLQKIGFTEFTTHLVHDVYRVIVEASMDQLKAYASYVDVVADSLTDYLNKVTGPDTAAKKATADSYILNVLQLTVSSVGYTLTADQQAGLVQHFAGTEVADAGTLYPIDHFIDASTHVIKEDDLRSFVIAKLESQATDTYNILKTVLQLGMQKVVVDRGEISTKLTFHVDSSETYLKTNDNYNTNASSWGVGGSLSGRYGVGALGSVASTLGSFIGGGISGGYNSRKLSVSVVNEKSTAATNVNVDILGEVKILFRTDSFPAIAS
jgi:hypothetical protein